MRAPRYIANDELLTHLVNEWHPTKNKEFTPYNITVGSNRQIFWRCQKNIEHEWATTPNARVAQRQGCPYCSGQKVFAGDNDLATTNPDLAREWHPTLNINVTPQDVTAFTSKKVMWLCPVGSDHIWEASINSRVRGNKCPYCGNRKILTGFNDLGSAKEYSHVLLQWHPTLNTDFTPAEVSPTSGKYAWWLCDVCDHEWKSIIANRTSKNSGCPDCSKKNKNKKRKTLESSALAKEWHPDNDKKVYEVTLGSAYLARWVCPIDPTHIWKATVANRVRGTSNCTVCSNRQIVSGFNDLASYPEYSHLVSEWHPDNILSPYEVGTGTEERIKWICQEGHIWDTKVYNRTIKAQGCPECAGRRTQSGERLVVSDFPNLLAQWHIDNHILPEKVTSQSAKKIKWMCPKNNLHIWVASVASRSLDGSDCPVCAGRKIIRGVNDLSSYSEYDHLIKEWHPDNTVSPYDVSRSSLTMLKWQCQEKHDHVWEAVLSSRTHASAPSGCPRCALAKTTSKGEDEIHAVIELLGLDVQQSVNNLIYNREIDLYIPSKKFAIEFNGIYWHSEVIRPDPLYHQNKRNACLELDIIPYNVWESDWKYNRNIVIRDIAYQLDALDKLPLVLEDAPISWSETLDVVSTTAQKISRAVAKEFFTENHLRGFVEGSVYIGLIDSSDNLRAAMILNDDLVSHHVDIMRYATVGNVLNGFNGLLSFAESFISAKSWNVVADLAVDNGNVYKDSGFKKKSDIAPDFSYIVRNRLVDKTEYRVNKFKSDPSLKYVEGLSEKELASLNNMPRIWDFGKISYVKKLTKKD